MDAATQTTITKIVVALALLLEEKGIASRAEFAKVMIQSMAPDGVSSPEAETAATGLLEMIVAGLDYTAPGRAPTN